MRNSVFCSVCLVFFGSVNEVMAQPVATAFSSPVRPVTAYNNSANPFLAFYLGHGHHLGEDRNANDGTDYNDPVYSTAVGKVVLVRDITNKDSWGKVVIVSHKLPDGSTIYSLYAHLSKILVTNGQIVYPNKPLGKIGDANGYYAGAAHLHFELRSVNDWTPKSPGYLKTVSITAVRKYLDPSLFIDDRADQMSISTSGPLTVSSEEFVVSNYTPASLAYVVKGNKTLSLPSAITAGWLDSTAYVRTTGTSHWESIALADIVFGPDIDFQIEFLEKCELAIVVPGHHFQASRARGDMIKAADRAGFTRVKMETFTELGDDGTLAYDLCSLCFDDGPNTGVGCLVQATQYDNPLIRYVIWYDPATNTGIGDWITIDPNDID